MKWHDLYSESFCSSGKHRRQTSTGIRRKREERFRKRIYGLVSSGLGNGDGEFTQELWGASWFVRILLFAGQELSTSEFVMQIRVNALGSVHRKSDRCNIKDKWFSSSKSKRKDPLNFKEAGRSISLASIMKYGVLSVFSGRSIAYFFRKIYAMNCRIQDRNGFYTFVPIFQRVRLFFQTPFEGLDAVPGWSV